mgnify:FL=1
MEHHLPVLSKAPEPYTAFIGTPEQIGLLAGALGKAQASFPPIARNKTAKVSLKTGGAYTIQYAELGEILALTRPKLGENGLAITHLLEGAELLCVLMHSGGGRLESRLQMPPRGLPQELGGWLTYMRRYLTCGLLGIAPEDDDDANVAAGDRETTETQARATHTTVGPKTPVAPTEADRFTEMEAAAAAGTIAAPKAPAKEYKLEPPGTVVVVLSPEALQKICIKQKEKGISDEHFKAWLSATLMIASRKLIPAALVPKVMMWLNGQPAPAPLPAPVIPAAPAIATPDQAAQEQLLYQILQHAADGGFNEATFLAFANDVTGTTIPTVNDLDKLEPNQLIDLLTALSKHGK